MCITSKYSRGIHIVMQAFRMEMGDFLSKAEGAGVAAFSPLPISANSDLPLPHGLAPPGTMVPIPLWALQTLWIKGFLSLARPFLDLVLQTPRPRGRGRPLFADNMNCVIFLANPFAPYRGQKPQNREKRVSESRNAHFRPPQKRASRVKKSPFSLWCPV